MTILPLSSGMKRGLVFSFINQRDLGLTDARDIATIGRLFMVERVLFIGR